MKKKNEKNKNKGFEHTLKLFHSELGKEYLVTPDGISEIKNINQKLAMFGE